MSSAYSKLLKTEAIVLKKKELLEKDILLTLFTHEFGKVTVIAKGVRKLTSRRAAHIETINLIQVILYNRNEVLYLQGTEVISAFSGIKKDQRKINYIYRYIFILDRLLPEQQPEPLVYAITKKFFIRISKKADFTEDDFVLFLKETLSAFGYGAIGDSVEALIRQIQEIIQEKVPENVII